MDFMTTSICDINNLQVISIVSNNEHLQVDGFTSCFVSYVLQVISDIYKWIRMFYKWSTFFIMEIIGIPCIIPLDGYLEWKPIKGI